MNNDNGGPAFPKAALDPWGKTAVFSTGMTLRDYFAAKAMQAMISNNWPMHTTDAIVMISSGAYEMADAMLKERAK